MINFTTCANVANSFLKVLQGYTKGIRFIALLTILCTIGVGQMWGANVVCDFTTQTVGNSSYTTKWTYGDFTVFGGANNNKGWAYVKMGGKKDNLTQANPVYISSPQMTSAISKVQVSIIAGSLAKSGMSVNSWGVYVYSDANMTNQVDYVAGGTITKFAAVFEFTPTSGTTWSANNYYKVSFNLTNTTTTNGIIWLDKITFVESTSGGGGSTPTQLSAPTDLKVGDITSSGATLSWNAVANASSYVVTIVDGGSYSQSYTVTETTKTVSGLTPSTDYLWTVTAVGDGTNYTNSEESETGEFTTSAPASGGEGDGEETWTLVTNASNLKAGDQIVIAATGSAFALGPQASNNRTAVAITKTGNNITWTTDVQIITLETGNKANTFAFNTGVGYLYAVSSSDNHLRTKTTLDDNGSWAISITPEGVATIKAQGTSTRNWIRKNSSSAIFSCYGSGQSDVAIYKKVTSSGGSEPEPVIVKTLKSIAVTVTTTTFEQGDVFKFDGTCTATYSVTKDGAAQADETAEVTPTSVSTPNMNTIGTQTVTVTYSEGGVEKTAEYQITITENTVTAGTYCTGTLGYEFWGLNAEKTTATANEVDYTGMFDDIIVNIKNGEKANAYFKADHTRVYSGGYTMTFTAPTNYVITAIAFTADGNNWEGTHTANVGTMTDSKNWAGSANEVTITFGGTCRIKEICVTYEELDETLPTVPTFNPAAGTYNAVQNVTISAEAGTTIYYTLDGTDPTTASDVYASAIEISETTTVKAIAVKDEKVSPVATATYTINLPLTTMDQIFAKATAVGSTATSVEITFGNWVVTGVKNSNAYVTDGTKGFIIYTASHGFLAGDILSGTVSCKVQLYKGSAELTELTSTTTGLTVSKGGEVTPIELDEEGIATLTGINTGSVIKINGTCSQGNIISDIRLYNTLYSFEDLTVGAKYDVTGVYLLFESTKEILPRGAEDIVKTQDLPTATISIANISLEIEKQATIEATITPDAAKNTVTYTIKSGDEYITLNGTTITAKAVGEATITATIPESIGNYSGTTKDFTVTVTPKNIAVLPFAFNSGKEDIEGTLGMSQNGLGSDYGSAPLLKFDGTDDYVIIHFDSEPGMLSYDIKGNSYSGGTFTVQESEDGSAYTNIVEYTELGSTETKTHTLTSTSRYVKFIYTNKSSGNVGLGNITISKPDNRAEAGLAWDPETVTLTIGDAFTAPTLSNPNSVSGITYKSSNTDVATVTDAGVIALAGATGEATITATFDGNEDYKPAEVSCTITVNPLTTYTVTLNPNYPTGKTGTFIDKEENTVNGNLEISLPSGTATQPIADLYTSIALDGYIFEGWYDAASEGNYREKTGPITKDITFYAHWKVPYTVTFDAGTAGTCTPSSITETTANGITLPAATLTDCDDWTFLGWAETAIASKTETPPASFFAGGSIYKPTADIILYAVYKRVEGGGGESATLTFDDTSKRTTRTTNQQVWTENGITLTNNKSESTDTVAAYYNPVRFYKSSEIIIEAPGNITQIVASTSGAEYTTALQSSVGPEASATSNVVTITPTASSNTYTINLTAGQTRLSSITVTYGGSLSTSYYHSTPLCQVTITYYGFGGGYTTDCETDPNAIVITKGDTYQIPNCEPTDYDNTLNRTFAGTWNTKANGKGTAYKPGEEFIVNSDITLYAQWTLNTIGNTTLPTGEELLANTDIVVTGGNTLTLQAGTTTINSLTLKGGLQENGTYAMPVVNIPEGATLVRNNNKINLDLKINNNSYYPFAVPFEVANTSANVNYINTTLKEYANAHDGYGNYYRILEYNGALRAENGVNSAENWVHVGRTDVKLMPGKGYAISAVPASGQDTVTIRITMNVDNAWLANGEQESITVKEQTTTRNQVTVTAHGGKAANEHPRHAGWNFVANPYLSNFTANENISGAGYINGEIIINNGEYSYGGENVPYVTIPTYNFAHYYQLKLSEATLSPAYSFFVQIDEGDTMSFDVAGRQAAPAGLAARSAEERPVKMDVDITLSDNHRSDATGLIICDRYNDEYEIGRDLEKMFGSAANLSVYTLMADNTPLAFQALAIRSNMQVIPVGYRTPAQGEYTFALNEATSSIDLLNEQYEQLVLVDYQTGELTNLLIADYTFYSERTQADNRFAIYAVPRQNAPTDLPNAIGQDKEAQKIIHNGHLYILRDGNVYNGNGQIVK